MDIYKVGEIMQVNSSNGSLQNRYFSGTGSIGGIHLPDFNDKYVFSKKKSGISDVHHQCGGCQADGNVHDPIPGAERVLLTDAAIAQQPDFLR